MKRRRDVTPELPGLFARVPASAVDESHAIVRAGVDRLAADLASSAEPPATSTAVGFAAHCIATVSDTRVEIELDGLDVACVRHPDRPAWYVVVWPAGARARALAEGRGPEGAVVASASYIEGGSPTNWRVRPGVELDAGRLGALSHAVVRAVAAYIEEATNGAR